MDFSQALGAEFREVQQRTHDGKPARAVIGSRSFRTDSLDLWDALTSAERIARWFLPITGDLQIGGRYQLEGNAGGVITRCDPPRALDVTWEYAGNVSWVSLRLESDGDETRLTLEHVMLKDDAAEKHWVEYGPGATGVGWDLSFVGLALHVDSGGEVIDQEAVGAWMASVEGKDFMRTCADGWGAAHIACGADPDLARSMAERTATAYAGG